MSNKIYNISIDEHFDENLKLFTENLSSDEEIISTATIDGPIGVCGRFIICTHKKETKNLLLEETKNRRIL